VGGKTGESAGERGCAKDDETGRAPQAGNARVARRGLVSVALHAESLPLADENRMNHS
jgi:hypothetical protein